MKFIFDVWNITRREKFISDQMYKKSGKDIYYIKIEWLIIVAYEKRFKTKTVCQPILLRRIYFMINLNLYIIKAIYLLTNNTESRNNFTRKSYRTYYTIDVCLLYRL